jgi:hypothetical protein
MFGDSENAQQVFQNIMAVPDILSTTAEFLVFVYFDGDMVQNLVT